MKVNVKDKCVYLLCRDTLSIFKSENLERHYRTKHTDFVLKFLENTSLQQVTR